jgi:hypothetical protein
MIFIVEGDTKNRPAGPDTCAIPPKFNLGADRELITQQLEKEDRLERQAEIRTNFVVDKWTSDA